MILLFAKYPTPGKAKTRLIPALGPEVAARLHRRLTETVVAVAKATGEAVTVCTTGAPTSRFRAWLGPDVQYRKQPAGDLGRRLEHAFSSAFREGNRHVIAIGADVPDLTPDILQNALRVLESSDVALGQAADGGYYLIGMNRLHAELFRGLDWGTDRVCGQTRSIIKKINLRVAKSPELNDIDRPEDLSSLRDSPRFHDVFTGRSRISVIIPTLNEEASIQKTLARVRAAKDVEIIVSDGGSTDPTCALAEQAGAELLKVSGGRAAQLNAGAAKATGRLLLFLHADTLLPEGYDDAIRVAMDHPGMAGGAFQFRTDAANLGMRLVEWGTNIRSKLFRLPYGDQGLFMEKRVFEELGGFAEIPIMEDFEFVRRLRRRGRIVTLHHTAVTSARRWRQLGVIRTTFRNTCMIIGFLLGISPQRLKRFYSAGPASSR